MKHETLLLLASLSLCACGGGGGGLSRSDAAERVVDQLVDANDPMIVFSHEDVVGPGSDLREGIPADVREASPVPIEGESWLFWIDDEPGARFDHPTRFVLVDRKSGEITIHDARWWPVLDGTGLWTDDEAYWDSDNWVHGPSESPRKATITEPLALGDVCQPGFGTALVINGHKEGQTGGTDMNADGTNMTQTLGDMGFDTTYAGPADAPGVEMGTERDDLDEWFEAKAKELKPGDNLVVYITGHGLQADAETAAMYPNLGDGYAGGIFEGTLETWLARFDPGVNVTVIIDTCHAGAMLDGLTCVADLGIAAARDDQSSYSDIDWQFGTDPDEEDEGGEFTSALARSMRELVGDAAERERIENTAEGAGGSFMGTLMTEAMLRARMYDFANQLGWTDPVAQSGAAKTRLPDSTPPVCTADPGGSSSDDGHSDSEGDTDSGDPTGTACDEFAAAALALGDILDADVDAEVCGGGESLPTGNEVLHSDGEGTSTAEGECDFHSGGYMLDLQIGVDLPCGESAGRLVLCPPDSLPLADGPFIVIWSETVEPIPFAHDTNWYQYGFVFDRDGNSKNNYVPSPSYPSDFFADTDFWLYGSYDPSGGWRMFASDASDGVTAVPSAARIVLQDGIITLVIPQSEVDPALASYRMSAFRHLGDYGSSQPWTGDVVPSVADGLLPLQ